MEYKKIYLKDEDETEDRESSDDDNDLTDILIRDRWEVGKLVQFDTRTIAPIRGKFIYTTSKNYFSTRQSSSFFYLLMQVKENTKIYITNRNIGYKL